MGAKAGAYIAHTHTHCFYFPTFPTAGGLVQAALPGFPTIPMDDDPTGFNWHFWTKFHRCKSQINANRVSEKS